MSKFNLGHFLTTPGVLEALERTGEDIGVFINRHAAGDWGIVDRDDARANEKALKVGARLLSAYRLSDGTKIWIITESDRAATTVLLPDEY